MGRLNLSPLLPSRRLETRHLLLGELGILGPRLPRPRARRLNRLQIFEEVARVVGDAVELVAQVVDGFRIHFAQNVVHDGDGIALASDLGAGECIRWGEGDTPPPGPALRSSA